MKHHTNRKTIVGNNVKTEDSRIQCNFFPYVARGKKDEQVISDKFVLPNTVRVKYFLLKKKQLLSTDGIM